MIMRFRKTLPLINKIKDATTEFIAQELAKQGVTGIVPSHGEILFALYENRAPLTMGELAGYIRKTQPTVTVLVEKLIDLGYIKKSKSATDARVNYITLTAQGETFKPIFYDVSTRLNATVHAGLSELEADILEKLLARVMQNFERSG